MLQLINTERLSDSPRDKQQLSSSPVTSLSGVPSLPQGWGWVQEQDVPRTRPGCRAQTTWGKWKKAVALVGSSTLITPVSRNYLPVEGCSQARLRESLGS